MAEGELPQLNEIHQNVFRYMKSGKASLGEAMGDAMDPKRNVTVPLVDVELQYADGTPILVTQTDMMGKFSFPNLSPDDYKIVIDDAAYRRLDLYFTIEGDELLQLSPVWLVPEEVIDVGDAGGQVLNVMNGNPLNGVALDFRRGINPPDTEQIVYQTTTAGGWLNYTYDALQLPTGVYTVSASKAGFRSDQFYIYVLGATDTRPQDGWLSPPLGINEFRIVLTWGVAPDDLDSHLWAPNPFGTGKVHLYYGNRTSNPWGASFNLDLDDLFSFGPETTSIYQWEPETYCFYVHDYTNQDYGSSAAMSNSGAMVAVLTATSTTFFNITPNTSAVEWGVFTIDGATKQITPLNTYATGPLLDTSVGTACLSM
jgi:hypothetical protein